MITLIAAILLGHAEFPAIVKEKNLYAKTDFRGKAAPKLEFGKFLEAKSPDLKGKVVVIDFWATWCGPCRELIPEMNKWAKEFKGKVVFIGLSDETEEKVSEFRKTTPMEYNVAIDATKKLSNQLGVQGIPHVMVISPDGVVRWQGWPQDDKDRLTTEKLAQIIAASKVQN